jgi:DNA repair exonuclease SbcCD ATPase subunit
MRLTYVEMVGFRSFRKRTRIEIPHGFLVITGRNGTGKSTLIDAVEFALTGTIGKYHSETAGNESIKDYFWWRGGGGAEGYSVTVGFQLENGTSVVLTRTRDQGVDLSDAKIIELLCAPGFSDSAASVCRSSIIRDELITALSWDQTDTARFEFVRAALGARPPVEAGRTLPDAIKAAQKSLSDTEREAELVGARLRAALADLSESSALAERATDLRDAVAALQAVVGSQVSEVSQLLAAGRRYISERRSALQAVSTFELDLAALYELRARVQEPNYIRQLEATAEWVTRLMAAHEEALADTGVAREELAQQEAASAEATADAALLESGERLGLQEGKCPLCGVDQSEAHYRAALETLRRRLSDRAASVLAARTKLSNSSRTEERRRAELLRAQAEQRQLMEVQQQLKEVEAVVVADWRRISSSEASLPPIHDVAFRLATEEDQLSRLERHVFVLEASQSVERIARVEQTIATAREELEKLNTRAGRLKAAIADVKEAERAIKRANGEVVDERLASLSPLLSELYYRLRPHRNWRTIDYRIRGDVRRFLSLRVGDDLNPQFMFSSGERRAAGLAFLLAVSLSRAWCQWRTLILDDPVQHVDDFRALHLVEALSSIRRADRQIVCAVEDGELGELLCRRLRSTIQSPGARVDLEHNGELGSYIEKWTPVSPLPEATVLSEEIARSA